LFIGVERAPILNILGNRWSNLLLPVHLCSKSFSGLFRPFEIFSSGFMGSPRAVGALQSWNCDPSLGSPPPCAANQPQFCFDKVHAPPHLTSGRCFQDSFPLWLSLAPLQIAHPPLPTFLRETILFLTEKRLVCCGIRTLLCGPDPSFPLLLVREDTL